MLASGRLRTVLCACNRSIRRYFVVALEQIVVNVMVCMLVLYFG